VSLSGILKTLGKIPAFCFFFVAFTFTEAFGFYFAFVGGFTFGFGFTFVGAISIPLAAAFSLVGALAVAFAFFTTCAGFPFFGDGLRPNCFLVSMAALLNGEKKEEVGKKHCC
jgi:hypothetical protein